MVEWAYTLFGLLQGQGGSSFNGLAQSVRASLCPSLSLFIASAPGQSWHRALLPHTTAGKDFHTGSFFFPDKPDQRYSSISATVKVG